MLHDTLEDALTRWPSHRVEIEDWIGMLRLLRLQRQRDHELLEQLEAEPVDNRDLALVRSVMQPQSKPASSPWRRYAGPVVLAATLLLGVGVAFFAFSDSPAVEDPDKRPFMLGGSKRSSPGTLVVDEFNGFEYGELTLPLFGSYRLTLESRDGALLLVTETKEPEYMLTAKERLELEDVDELQWRVDVLNSDGQVIESTGLLKSRKR